MEPNVREYLIFVYGTLKTGFCRNHFLQGCRLLGNADTKPFYRLYDCGDYPGLVINRKAGRSIQGEVWLVDEARLSVLDRIEAVDEGLYCRVPVELADAFYQTTVDPDSVIQAYLYKPSVKGLVDCGCQWEK